MVRFILALSVLFVGGCYELDAPRDVSGNFDVTFADNLRVFIGDELVAEVTPGSEEEIEWGGGSFTVSQVCEDQATECPGESWWRHVAVDQPWGPKYQLLNFVNLDLEHGEPGQRMGGTLENDGTFTMLSGLAVGGGDGCAALGVGTVTGAFSPNADAVVDGIVAYEWAGGCQIGEVTIGTNLRLESDYSAQRKGPYDVSSVTPEAPIDEEGVEVDPEEPDAGSEFGG